MKKIMIGMALLVATVVNAQYVVLTNAPSAFQYWVLFKDDDGSQLGSIQSVTLQPYENVSGFNDDGNGLDIQFGNTPDFYNPSGTSGQGTTSSFPYNFASVFNIVNNPGGSFLLDYAGINSYNDTASLAPAGNEFSFTPSSVPEGSTNVFLLAGLSALLIRHQTRFSLLSSQTRTMKRVVPQRQSMG